MSDSSATSAHIEEELSLPVFFLIVASSLAGLIGVLWLAAPKSVWLAQIGATAGQFIAAFLVMKLFNCFIEYFFHRYVLHKPVVPFLSRFYRQHTLHHNLTRIGRRRTPGGKEVPVVENIYPMTAPEQGEASFFPWFTLVVFGLIITPVLALLQWLVPSLPWFFAGYAALAASLILYEVFHAIEHWPFEKWAVLIENPRWGRFWRKVYSFHLRHHAVIDCNEAISGFFTLPVADFVFRTWIFPKSLYTDGGEWEASEFTSPRPCRFIRWCDEASENIVRNRRLAAQGAPLQPVIPPTPARQYSRLERIAHALTHGAGLAASATSLALLVAFAAVKGDAWHLATFAVFGVTLVLLYTAFALYHRHETAEWKLALRKYTHAAVFLTIAGTATPFLLVSMRGPWGWSLFGVIWGLCTAGVAFQLLFGGRYRAVSAVAYLLVGALAVFAVKPVVALLPPGGLWLVISGVLCYTAGIAFYLWRLPRFDAVPRMLCFHAGSVCHLLAVLLFVLPAQG
ncbi:MAG TPA: hemolysin III family protein [Opitutaceae bacterium]|nr:hemolysin III family protein [Opitutaceae bacterium]